ncbi:hypothetical protein NDU88_000738 [Pleurodeles waltl]|uniref:Uncharacterized protein n=1 Tax=Pleurodeles waltl TaxID=8319 RepID=A0AAV7VVL1_PLEWA|nr:hypothetical protein NDU88_000738 [Pleurodeles waltl]
MGGAGCQGAAAQHWSRPVHSSACGELCLDLTVHPGARVTCGADAVWSLAGCGIGWHRQSTTSQQNTIEQYTTSVPLPQLQVRSGGPEDVLGVPETTGEPSRAELLGPIQGSGGKIETVAVEVNVLRADPMKVSEKVKVAESSIMELQTEVDYLCKQMV